MTVDLDSQSLNAYQNRPQIGEVIEDWKTPLLPQQKVISGTFTQLKILNVDLHGKDLFAANRLNRSGSNWLYLPYGPFADIKAYMDWIRENTHSGDPLFYAIMDSTRDRAIGVASYLNIVPEHGRIEVGHINYSPLLQQSTAATEAMYLMMKQAFDRGYRRYEWKCDSLNLPSRHAALRLGFSFEGVHRQHVLSKGRNRDTAWYSILDSEWPSISREFERWLSPQNFNDEGRQLSKLDNSRMNQQH